MQIPFHRQALPKTFDEIVTKSISQGWLTTGPVVKSFEATLKNYLESEYVVAVNSCTAALHLAIAAKDFKKGDRFIAPTYTFVATVEAGEYLDMKPVLIDSDDNYNLDLNQVEDCLKNDAKIKCILPVHFGGRPVNMLELNAFSDKYGAVVIEDAAHAAGSTSEGMKIGSHGKLVCFSFHPAKNLAMPTGGLIAINDPNYKKIKDKLNSSRWCGIANRKGVSYDVREIGNNYYMNEISAAIGIEQLKYINDIVAKHIDNQTYYDEALSDIKGISIINKPSFSKSSSWLYTIHVEKRELFMKWMSEQKIMTSRVHERNDIHTAFANSVCPLPNLDKFNETQVSIPVGWWISSEDREYIVSQIKEFSLKILKYT